MFLRNSVNIAVATAISSLVMVNSANALSLGQIKVRSVVNKPFVATLEMADLPKAGTVLSFKTASAQQYANFGLKKTIPQFFFKFKQVNKKGGYLIITSQVPVKTAKLDLVFNVREGDSQFQYTATVPILGATAQPRVIQSSPVAAPQPKQAVRKQPVAKAQPKSTRKVQQKPTAVRGTTSKPQVEYAKPAVKKLTVAKRPQVVSQKAARSTYRVKKNQSLWGVSNRYAKVHGIRTNTVMKSVYHLNKKSFINENANLLKNGSLLVLPHHSEVYSLARKSSLDFNKVYKPAKKVVKSTKKVAKSVPKLYKPSNNLQVVTKDSASSKSKSAEGNNQNKQTGNEKASPAIIQRILDLFTKKTEVNKENNELNLQISTIDQKIEIQNAKIAQLQAKLKQLRKKEDKK